MIPLSAHIISIMDAKLWMASPILKCLSIGPADSLFTGRNAVMLNAVNPIAIKNCTTLSTKIWVLIRWSIVITVNKETTPKITAATLASWANSRLNFLVNIIEDQVLLRYLIGAASVGPNGFVGTGSEFGIIVWYPFTIKLYTDEWLSHS